MFDNPGTKIKNLAKTLFVIGVVLSIAFAVLMFAVEIIDVIVLIPVIALVGIGMSYFSCLLLAAFGELVETNTKLLEEARKKNAGEEYSKQ